MLQRTSYVITSTLLSDLDCEKAKLRGLFIYYDVDFDYIYFDVDLDSCLSVPAQNK